MKLDRNINLDRQGKYALILLRELATYRPEEPFAPAPAFDEIEAALNLLLEHGILDQGIVGTPSEFFLIRLKDKYAQAALKAYADAARVDDPEYAAEIDEMAKRSGPAHPNCKRPD